MASQNQIVSANFKPFHGFAYGLRQPSILVALHVNGPVQIQLLRNFCNQLCQQLINEEFLPAEDMSQELAAPFVGEVLMTLIRALQISAELPVMDESRIHSRSADGTGAEVLLSVTNQVQPYVRKILGRIINVLNQLAQGRPDADINKRLTNWLKILRPAAKGGSNIPFFYNAAHELGIPVFELVGDASQFGMSSRQCWLESSFTEVTPVISARLVRNKFQCASALRQMGFPTPQHSLASSPDVAVSVAEKLGYPVVVKPADLDGGAGVSCGLLTVEEVRAAFGKAHKVSKRVLVEKHVDARDYRLYVFQGEMVHAIERVPASVVGDGKQTIRELVEEENVRSKRGVRGYTPLRKLVLDDEAAKLCQRQGFGFDDVPEKEKFIRLRSTANIVTGGKALTVSDDVHPENLKLVCQVVDALKLDLAGVDLLIPDIGVSWRESGAVICEVNGRPTIGKFTSAHMYPLILKKLVSGSGRIPITIVVGDEQGEAVVKPLVKKIIAQGKRVGWHCEGKAFINDEEVGVGELAFFQAGRIFVLSEQVEAMVLSLSDLSVLRSGLPFDRYDVLVLAGADISIAQDEGTMDHEKLFEDLVEALIPACAGSKLLLKGISVRAGSPVSGFEEVTKRGLANKLAEIMESAEANLSQPL